MSNLAAQGREALLAHHFSYARELLATAHQEAPNDAEVLCEYLICESYFGNEELAAKRFFETKTATRHHDLQLLLSRYFFCRQQLARKRSRDDIQADRWLSQHHYTPETNIGVKISACLIVKDEEAVLDKCLKSLQGVVDEIVVVDTGSKDRTVEIAQSYGAVIGHFKWTNDFSAARNYSLSLSSGDWSLWIDADEQLDPACKEAFDLGVVRPHIGGYSIQIVNYLDDGGTTSEFIHSPTRLFRKGPEIFFTEPIHEQINPSLMALGLPWTPLPGAVIHHDGYREAALESKNKVERTKSMLEKVVEQNPNDAFQIFNLANTYFVARDYEKAAKMAERAVQLMPPAGAEYGHAAFQVLATSLDLSGRHQEALAACQKCDQTSYGGIVNEYLKATALMNIGRFEEALSVIDYALTLDWPNDIIGDKGIADFRRHGLKGQILGCLGRWSESLEWFEACLERQPNFPASILGRAMALEHLERFDEAELAYRQAMADHRQNSLCERGMGSICEKKGEIHRAAGHYKVAWQANPDNISLWELWVSALEKVDDQSGINNAYEALANAKQITPGVLVNWARALERSGDYEKALECYRDALQLDPTEPNIPFNCGDLLYRMAAYADAARMYEAGLRLRMDYAEGWFVLGNCMAQLGVDSAAIQCYEQTLNLDPNHGRAKANLDVVRSAA
jgi:tetratricopeptide (TPR) repeat protein